MPTSLPARLPRDAPPTVADAVRPGRSAAPPRRITTAELLGGAVEIEIIHGESHYRLRRTATGKLILTK